MVAIVCEVVARMLLGVFFSICRATWHFIGWCSRWMLGYYCVFSVVFQVVAMVFLDFVVFQVYSNTFKFKF